MLFDTEHQKRWIKQISDHVNHAEVSIDNQDINKLYFRLKQIYKIAKSFCTILELTEPTSINFESTEDH